MKGINVRVQIALWRVYKISFLIYRGNQISSYIEKNDTPIHTYLFEKNNYSSQFCVLFSYAVISLITIIMQLSVRKLWRGEVMVLYWSYWFSVRGSHSQGETITVHPLLGDNLGQRNKNSLFSWTSMKRKNRRRWDLSGTSVPRPYSYTKTCEILSEKYTIITTSVLWVIGELAPATAQWLVHHCVRWVLSWLENKTYTLCITAAFSEVFPDSNSSTDSQKIWKFEEVILYKNDFSPIRDFPTCARCKLIGSHYNI